MLSRRRAATLTAAYYAVIFAALGAHLPYWPVWLEAWGLDEAEIGSFLGAATLTRIAGSTMLPALADRFAIRRWMIVGTSLATAAMFLAHLAIDSRGPLLGATLVLGLVMAPSIPIGEALGLRAAERYGFGYAAVRSAGSLGFLAANVGIGALLDRLGPDLVIWTVAAGFLATAAVGALHPGGGAAAGADSDRAGRGEALRLFRDPVFLAFALAVAMGHAAHVVYYVYSVLAWQAQGLSGALIGWLWAFGVIVEMVLMLGPGRTIVERIGASHALAAGALAGVLRWTAMALEPGLVWLWPLQGLHALTFALAHLGAMAFVARAVPLRLAATAQGLLSGVASGIATAAALAIAGAVIARAGVPAGYLFAAVLAALSLGGALALGRLWSGGQLATRAAPR